MVPWIGPAPGDVSMLMVMFFIAIFWIVQDTQQIMTTSATATAMAFDGSSTFEEPSANVINEILQSSH